MKSGQNNNGYVPYVDYARDYSPPPQTLSLRSNGSQMTATTTMNGQIPTGNLSLTRNRVNDIRQENGLPNIQGSVNSLQNGLLGKTF